MAKQVDATRRVSVKGKPHAVKGYYNAQGKPKEAETPKGRDVAELVAQMNDSDSGRDPDEMVAETDGSVWKSFMRRADKQFPYEPENENAITGAVIFQQTDSGVRLMMCDTYSVVVTELEGEQMFANEGDVAAIPKKELKKLNDLKAPSPLELHYADGELSVSYEDDGNARERQFGEIEGDKRDDVAKWGTKVAGFVEAAEAEITVDYEIDRKAVLNAIDELNGLGCWRAGVAVCLQPQPDGTLKMTSEHIKPASGKYRTVTVEGGVVKQNREAAEQSNPTYGHDSVVEHTFTRGELEKAVEACAGKKFRLSVGKPTTAEGEVSLAAIASTGKHASQQSWINHRDEPLTEDD